MELTEAIRTWRSIRAYLPEPIPRATIETLVDDATRVSTPPAADEPWAIAVIEGVARIEDCGVRAMDWARAHRPPGAPGWSWVDRPGFRVFWGAPAVVVIAARRGAAEAPFDCCRAGQNLALAAHAAGLGTCWIGAALPWLRSPGVADELGLPTGFDASVVMLLGRPAATPPPKSRPRPRIAWF
jgi:nitroreductase